MSDFAVLAGSRHSLLKPVLLESQFPWSSSYYLLNIHIYIYIYLRIYLELISFLVPVKTGVHYIQIDVSSVWLVLEQRNGVV